MHRLIMGKECDGLHVDHVDGNGLNNQRSNLRVATRSQNLGNRRKHVNASSRYKGVCWFKGRDKWRALIMCSGKRHHLGLFDSEEQAAMAYDAAALELFGEFACLNLPKKPMTTVSAYENTRNNEFAV